MTKPKSRPNRSPDELKAASHHVWYEFAMFAHSAYISTAGKPKFFENSVVETFAIHLRNVLDFLYPAKTENADDIYAIDLVPGWDSLRPPFKDKRRVVLRKRANKEIAHLTYARLDVTASEKPWNRHEIFSELEPAMHLFCERLPDTLKSDEWQIEPFAFGLSQAGLSTGAHDFIRELYQDALDNIRFLKRQQWTISNYALLIYGASIATHELLPGPGHPSPFEQGVLASVATVTAIAGISLLVSFQRGMRGNRKRLKRIRETHFDQSSLSAWQAFDKPKHTSMKHGAGFTAFLSGVLIAGAAFIWWLVYA